MTNLEYQRRLSGMNQMDLAIKLKCHASLVSKLERGWQNKVSPVVERRLTRVFTGWTIEGLLAPHTPADTKPDVSIAR